MHINVDTRPVTPNAYDSKKKRLVETIDRLHHRNARGPLQKMLARIHPADLAAILDELPPEHVVDIFHALGDKEMAAEVFNQIPADAGDDRVERQSTRQPARTPAPG